MTTITITLPYPPTALFPNARPHHMELHRKKSKYRKDAGLAALAACNAAGIRPPKWNFCLARAVFYKTGRQRPDPSNLNHAIKSGIDGIADAGVCNNDQGLILTAPGLEMVKKNPRVEITIRELDYIQFHEHLKA